MDLLCVGVSHKTAPLDVREKLALGPEKIAEVLQRVSGAAEAMVLSTCNRVEFYAVAPTPQKVRDSLRSLVASLGGVDSLEHSDGHGAAGPAVLLSRGAATVNSMVLGKPKTP